MAGLEPTISESKSEVLPLHYIAMSTCVVIDRTGTMSYFELSKGGNASLLLEITNFSLQLLDDIAVLFSSPTFHQLNSVFVMSDITSHFTFFLSLVVLITLIVIKVKFFSLHSTYDIIS